MTDKLTKKDQLIMSTVLDKLTIDMKIIIENALTDALLSLRVGAGVHLHHAMYSSTENATNKKLIEIIK